MKRILAVRKLNPLTNFQTALLDFLSLQVVNYANDHSY